MVYQGRHVVTQVEVAVKVLTHASGNADERFAREAQAASRVRSPHVIQVIDAGTTDGHRYLVMELVVGRSAGDILDEVRAQDQITPPTDRPVGSLDPRAVARIGIHVARGLAAIHAMGIVHRDIKPDNLMINAAGIGKVADLGLAKRLDDPELQRLTGTGMVVGTPLYVSPEGIRDPQSVTAAADVYGLGATLYHLLAGKPPFDGTTPYEVMRGHLEERFQPLAQIRPNLPPGLCEIVEQCLAKKPTDRPTCAALEVALAAERRVGPRKTPAVLVAAAAVVFAIAAAGMAAYLWLLPSHQAQVATTGLLTIDADHPAIEARLGDGPWSLVPAAGLPTPLGGHLLAVRARQPGAALSWSGTVTIASGAPTRIETPLSRQAIAPVRLTLPGTGMLFIDGLGFAAESNLSFTSVGTYAVGRWDGNVWITSEATITADGNGSLGNVSSRQKPDGPAWWRTVGPDDRPIEAHHVVTWWEAEQVRVRLTLAVPPAWRRQGDRPEQPVVELNPVLIDPLAEGARAGQGRFPDSKSAKNLSSRLGAPVWAKDGPNWKPIGGPSVNAWLLMVP